MRSHLWQRNLLRNDIVEGQLEHNASNMVENENFSLITELNTIKY